MPAVLTDLLQSKKFVFTLTVTVIVLVASRYGVLTNEEMHSFLKYLWPAYLGAQGLADLGKSAAKTTAASSGVPAPVTSVIAAAVEEKNEVEGTTVTKETTAEEKKADA